MKRFIQRFSDKITGVLNGFDRLILRGTLRELTYIREMKGFPGYGIRGCDSRILLVTPRALPTNSRRLLVKQP